MTPCNIQIHKVYALLQYDQLSYYSEVPFYDQDGREVSCDCRADQDKFTVLFDDFYDDAGRDGSFTFLVTKFVFLNANMHISEWLPPFGHIGH